MGIVLYAMMESPPCRAVLMAAKMLNVDLNVKILDLTKDEHLKNKDFVKLNPQKCVPTINDDGFILWESRAILRYLVEKYGANDELYPREVHTRAKIDQFLDFDIGTLYNELILYLVPIYYDKPTDIEHEEKFRKALLLLDNLLKGRQFVASDKLSIADISVIASLSFGESAEFDFTQYGNVTAWMKRTKQAIPCYNEISEPTVQSYKLVMRSLIQKHVK